MKKRILKIFTFVMAALMLSGIFTGCDINMQNKESLSYKIHNGEAEITSYKDKTTITELVIPDEIEGCPVTVIGKFGVMNSESLKKITIGKNVREIGDWSFTSDTALEEFVVHPKNQNFVSIDGVLYTKDMKTLLFYPAGKQEQDGTFTVPDSVEVINTKSFYRCEKLEKIIVPDSVKDIGEKAFHKCTELKEVVFTENSSLQHIGMDAFAYCTAIEKFTVPAAVTAIDDFAFYNCTGVKELIMLPKEDKVTLGERWYPTNNGQDYNGLEIKWQ